MTGVAERQETFVTGFDAFRNDPAFGAGALRQHREEAFARFVARGLPTSRDEEWRHTNIAPMTDLVFERSTVAAVTAASLKPFMLDSMAGTVVVVNGRLAPALSALGALPTGVTVRSLGDAPTEHPRQPDNANVFVDLNLAFLEDAVVIDIAPKTTVADPIHVLFVSVAASRPSLVSPRLIVTAGERAQASIVESYADVGRGQLLTNAVTDVHVSPGAIVDHVKLQRHGETFHTATMAVRAERGATFKSHSIALGGRIARNDVLSVLAGEGAECTLNGLYVGTGEGLVDNHTTIDHAMPHCPSHELYKGILAGRARAVFNGKIIVRPDAQKTNAKQTNKALLLTDDAQINTKPQLEIFADDVKCTHGAAIGQLDEDAMFYLRARGIDATKARNMLIHAFAGDVLDGIASEAVRESAMHAVETLLAIEES